jgi:2-polyprenyl-6-methoxyphenol hydroxylase-like FAD-dependent oxidoreductase
VSTK